MNTHKLHQLLREAMAEGREGPLCIFAKDKVSKEIWKILINLPTVKRCNGAQHTVEFEDLNMKTYVVRLYSYEYSDVYYLRDLMIGTALLIEPREFMKETMFREGVLPSLLPDGHLMIYEPSVGEGTIHGIYGYKLIWSDGEFVPKDGNTWFLDIFADSE